jgi:teichuronic acid biosynthesis glycosyltransferase TuaG
LCNTKSRQFFTAGLLSETIPLNRQPIPGLFSIIMPAYNCAATVEQSIRSVMAQSDPHWELLVTDDCSKDQTRAVVGRLATEDPRVKLLTPEKNSGAAGARNNSLNQAQGQFICFLDADDWWLPEMLANHRAQFAKGAKISFTSYWRVTEEGKRSLVNAPREVKPWQMYLINPIGNLTGAYDRAALGLELQQHIRHEDYLMWFNLVQRAGVARATVQPLANYRVSGASLSGNKFKAARWHWDLLRGPFKMSLVTAAGAFCIYSLWSVFLRVRERLLS